MNRILLEACCRMIETQRRLQHTITLMHEPWGGALCLDFANTLEPRGGPPPYPAPPDFDFRDELLTYHHLVAWTVHKNELALAAGGSLIANASNDPAAAEAVLNRAHTLRDAIYRVFWAIAHREAPPPGDLEVISSEYADAAAHAIILPSGTGFDWQWPAEESTLARPLWPVAWSAADLLTTGDQRRIKVCPGPGVDSVPCAWLFYDTSKNGSRRWCSMTDCGGATKARNQTERRRAARRASER
jgi:predicted RNA-binding Zn ribbon-like protein